MIFIQKIQPVFYGLPLRRLLPVDTFGPSHVDRSGIGPNAVIKWLVGCGVHWAGLRWVLEGF